MISTFTPDLHSSITLTMPLTMAVPVSIEPKRPSPIVNEIIFAPGAQPSNSRFVSLKPDAIDET